jgi:hypothetical protein
LKMLRILVYLYRLSNNRLTVPEARHSINPTLSDHRERRVGFLVNLSCVSKTRYNHYISSSLHRLLSRESTDSDTSIVEGKNSKRRHL